LRAAVDECQRQCIQAALARHGGNWAGAARELDIDASNLHKLARRLALKDWLLKT
jgi:anaerobic nitric oxide reductase transcription regulator